MNGLNHNFTKKCGLRKDFSHVRLHKKMKANNPAVFSKIGNNPIVASARHYE